jgi:CheY-like chemotaxis protein
MTADLETRLQEDMAERELTLRRLADTERLAALERLAGGIAHDINNVLQAIGNGAGLIAERSEDVGEVRRLAGRISTACRRGSSVTAHLLGLARQEEPVADVPGRELRAPLAAGGISHARVLLVDDDELVRDMMALALADAGFEVKTAEGGEAALAALKKGPVDVLVTDFSMPDLDGLVLIRTAQQRYPDLPALLITGYASDELQTAVDTGTGGRISFLRKPLTVAQLKQGIDLALHAVPAAA